MTLFGVSLISGVMVGVEFRFLEPKAPFVYSLVLDLFIIRIVVQKIKKDVG